MFKYYAGFFRNKNRLNPFSRIIMATEKKDWSHVEIIESIDDDFTDATCYGSVFPKSRSIKLHEMKKHYDLMLVIPLNVRIPQDECYTLLQSNLNKPYSFGQILLIGFKIVFFAQWAWFSNIKINLSKFLVCTEYAGIFMKEACRYVLPSTPDMLTLDNCEDLAIERLNQGEK